MFDIGWSELLVIGIVALIVIGPKELPGVLRAVGQYMTKIRRMASDFQGQFQEAMREAEVADLKKQIDDMTDTAKSYTEFDPIASVRNEIESLSADPLKDTSTPAVAMPADAPPQATPPEVAPLPDAPEPKSETALKTASTTGGGA
jgi:sec-independent protein translocase protein TatB